MPISLFDFQRREPAYVTAQDAVHDWLARAHAAADAAADPARLRRALERFGCASDCIAQRSHALADFTHHDWTRMRIFNVASFPAGRPLAARMAFFAEVVQEVFDAFYAVETVAPAHLIHVTCTGYVAPSPAQRLAATKGWTATVVTHAYHMGCYAAFPAIRQAAGFIASEGPTTRVDVVHTELCTLHLNPTLHDPEQLVIQSLFADGFVRYSLTGEPIRGPRFELAATAEEVLPDSSDAMTWQCAEWGFHMTLARDVPARIAQALPKFVAGLARRAGRSEAEVRQAVYAIHPGGPKIIEQVQAALELTDAQTAASRRILRACGNMSSATLPYVWADILDDVSVPDGALIVSLAFGPGLTLCGNLLVKRT
ncbi:MAG: naringenin-chalcone synthase [Chloracidobacterium sp.]|nr:naringenin-chalcone synthase [Chloracidobacterium sp.]MDW8216476.1 3-oxoacyl-[acyl-carrier-protein] synthase III C-terminal domain-containing protein [Acidobacteriota bacterium]